jgi:heme exporter protein B
MSTTNLQAFTTIVRRDFTLAMRNRHDWMNPLFFFILACSLFPLGIGPEPGILMRIAAGIIWVTALLAAMLSLDGLFRSDYEDGTLEQLILSPHPFIILVYGKILVHWLITGIPLMLLSPLLGVILHLPADGIFLLMAGLLLGTPVLSLIGSIGVALTVGLKRGGMLLSLLVLPLYVPILIFGTSAVDVGLGGLETSAHFLLMGAILVLAITLAPLATAAALRISI